MPSAENSPDGRRHVPNRAAHRVALKIRAELDEFLSIFLQKAEGNIKLTLLRIEKGAEHDPYLPDGIPEVLEPPLPRAQAQGTGSYAGYTTRHRAKWLSS